MNLLWSPQVPASDVRHVAGSRGRESHSYESGKRPGSVGAPNRRVRMSLVWEWEETRFLGWLVLTPPPRQQAQS